MSRSCLVTGGRARPQTGPRRCVPGALRPVGQGPGAGLPGNDRRPCDGLVKAIGEITSDDNTSTVRDDSSTGIQGDDNLGSMLVGTVMRKVKSRTWKKQRYFKLQEDCMTIWYKSKKAGKPHSTFSVGDLEGVREGHQSEVLLSLADEFPPDRCFTLVFRGRRGNLDLVADSADEARSWVRGTRKLMESLESMGERERLDQWIGDWFKKADKNKDGRMNFKETQDLLRMMNVDMNEQHCHSLFTMADRSQTGTLLDEEFVLFYKMLTKRDDVMRVFQDFSGDGQKLSAADLEDFLREEQLEAEDAAGHAARIIETYEPSDAAKQLNAVTFDGFLMYLGSAEGSIQDPRWCGLFQDLDQPLCHYFISSSHNTYLMEDQLRGQSSVEGYIRALTRGCRCVEVDCWDGPNGEPIVYHGHTFTSKILFRDVVQAVDKYAFKASDYPVILSIENHCSVEQQRTMAQHLNHILGDALLRSPLEGKGLTGLPSPEELKGKILLKAKKIGGLEERVGGLTEDPLTGEVSDEDEAAEIDNEHSHRETFRRKTKGLSTSPVLHVSTGSLGRKGISSSNTRVVAPSPLLQPTHRPRGDAGRQREPDVRGGWLARALRQVDHGLHGHEEEEEMPVGRTVLEVTNIRESANYTCLARSRQVLGTINATAQVIVKRTTLPIGLVRHTCSPSAIRFHRSPCPPPGLKECLVAAAELLAPDKAEGRPEPGPSGPAKERTHTGAPPDEEPAETTAPRGGGAPPAETEAGQGHSGQVDSQAEEQRGELGREEGQVAEEEPAAGVEDVGGGGSGERAGSRI
ncbi:unnamed protein product [Gadus morhua 'NCC']